MTADENSRGIWLAPDWSGLAIEAEDGEIVEVGREHGYGAWVSQGMLDVVPDHWVRLVPLAEPATEDSRISEIRAAMDAYRVPGPHDTVATLDRIRAILDRPPLPDAVRVFRYTKPGGPVYRAYPDGRVTRNAETIDPSNLAHCVASVAQGAMTETSEPLPDSEATAPRVFFPGDTVPAGTYLLNDGGGVLMPRDEPWEVIGLRRAYVELIVPSAEEWQATVARARHVFRDDGLGNLSRVPGTETCMHCGLKKRDEVHRRTAP